MQGVWKFLSDLPENNKQWCLAWVLFARPVFPQVAVFFASFQQGSTVHPRGFYTKPGLVDKSQVPTSIPTPLIRSLAWIGMLLTWCMKWNMGVSKNRGTPKWMVYNGNPIKMDDLGVPLFLETPIYIYIYFSTLKTNRKRTARMEVWKMILFPFKSGIFRFFYVRFRVCV